MKIKALAVQAVAALALCGLFAPGASAEETKEMTICGPMDPAVNSWYADHDRTEQEIAEAWKVDKFRYCAVASIPASSWSEATQAGYDCVAKSVDLRDKTVNDSAHGGEVIEPWDRVEIERIERCIVASTEGVLLKGPGKRRGAKNKKHSKKPQGQHRSTQPRAEAALAR